MTVSDSFRSLADLIDRFERDGFDVTDVTAPGDGMLEEDELEATMTVRLSSFEAIESDGAVEVSPIDADVSADGAVLTDVTVSVRLDDAAEDPESEPGAGPSTDATSDPEDPIEETGDPEPTDGSDDPTEPPAYKDPDRLRSVYEEHDSFPAMREALGVDVSAQTVRRHMIDQGIHEPASSVADDAADEPDENPADEVESGDVETTIADGIDLPTGVTLDDIKETVRAAQTVHDVQARLDIDRDRTKRLLTELNLIDLVCGRLTDEKEQGVTPEEIDQRIRESAPPNA